MMQTDAVAPTPGDVASVVLPAFGIEPRAIELRHRALNSVFLVTDARGNRYSVRVVCADHTLLAVQSQAVWMDSLWRHGVPGIPRVIPSLADELAVSLRLPGHREDRCCMVHEWVPGSELARQTSAEHLRSVGMLMASIHEHGAAFRPPPGFALPAIDLASYADPDGVEAEQARTVLSPESLSLFRTAYATVTAAWDGAERNEPGRRLIHNDMHMANLIVCGDKIGLIDFEQAGWGHPAQDIASTFYYLQSSPLYDRLWTAFREGYTMRLPWPEEEERGDVNAFIAAMCVMEALSACELCGDEEKRARRVEAAGQQVRRLLLI